LADWDDDRPVWTASLPCQPFSIAGEGKGGADDRNLWPAYFRLVQEFRPEHQFGEQVEAAIKLGWLDGVSTDLEQEGYTVGAVVLPAACVGAPHPRHRIFWVAYASIGRFAEQRRTNIARSGRHANGSFEVGGLAEPKGDERDWRLRDGNETGR